MIRLQKYLALCGVASRRKAEEIIASGRVTVNGHVIIEMGMSVDEYKDTVLLDGRKLRAETKKRYIILNKPKGYVTTLKDQFDRADITSLIEDVKERVFPVGRLDYDTEGLLILTNDGDFANAIAHPKNEIDKVYIARVKGEFTEEKAEKLRHGVLIDGKMTSPAGITVLKNDGRIQEIKVKIHEGRNRQVKKMFNAVTCNVVALKRVSVGVFNIGNLPLGKWREFNENEMKEVKKYKNIR